MTGSSVVAAAFSAAAWSVVFGSSYSCAITASVRSRSLASAHTRLPLPLSRSGFKTPVLTVMPLLM